MEPISRARAKGSNETKIRIHSSGHKGKPLKLVAEGTGNGSLGCRNVIQQCNVPDQQSPIYGENIEMATRGRRIRMHAERIANQGRVRRVLAGLQMRCANWIGYGSEFVLFVVVRSIVIRLVEIELTSSNLYPPPVNNITKTPSQCANAGNRRGLVVVCLAL